MKNSQKLADLTDLKIVENPEEIKGGFFFLFHGYGNKGGYGYGGNKGGYGGNKGGHGGHKGGHGGHKGGHGGY